LTQDNIDTASIKMELLGNISYTQEDINIYCGLVRDVNPFHNRGRVPLHLALGTISGLLFSWGERQSVKLAAITNQNCYIYELIQHSHLNWDIYHSLRVNKSYSVQAGVESFGNKSVNIILQIHDNDLSPSAPAVLISHISIRYT